MDSWLFTLQILQFPLIYGMVLQYMNIQNEGEAVVELDQFKSILATYTEPLVEVRDSL